MQQIGNHLLPAIQLSQIAQRLQNPAAQFPPAHRGDGAVEHRQQTGIACPAGFDQIKICLRCCIEHNVIGRRFTTQRREVIDFSTQVMLEIMNDRARRADRRRHFCATKTIKRFRFEMLAQGERRLFRKEGVTVVRKHTLNRRKTLFLAHQNFRRPNPCQFIS